ncbi:MAG TPA: SAM-dependent methyltransferase [Vicinamibacterales bacterium]|nr:SAM-dependent methyltransferase [Vicinamibacterales bacterium]
MQIADLIRKTIRERGPLTVAAFMDLALYDTTLGYYARAAQRSGRAGDFFTSVDVGPAFGDLLAVQIAEMAEILSEPESQDARTVSDVTSSFDLVEAGAGNGRLSADILRAIRRRHPPLYRRLRLHLVEASPIARAAQPVTLAEVADRLSTSGDSVPPRFEGVLVANELLDALPVHAVVMRNEGLRELYVDCRGDRLGIREGPPSIPELATHFDRLGVALEPGWRAEINLRAVSWVQEAARRLSRGFMILIDYGHDARELYSATHSGGTLTTFTRHTMEGPSPPSVDVPAWLASPGEQDITAHVDFTSVRQAAEAEGLTPLGYLDQTYFLLGLLEASDEALDLEKLANRLALKTLLMPGGLGSTHKVLILAKNVDAPHLKGCSYRLRAT